MLKLMFKWITKLPYKMSARPMHCISIHVFSISSNAGSIWHRDATLNNSRKLCLTVTYFVIHYLLSYIF